MNSFPLLVYAVGVICGAQIGERWGRRLVFILTNIVCMAGTIIVYTAKSYNQLLAGRMIVNFHVGMEAFLIPMFQAEIAPAAVRGSLTAIYGVNGVFAAFIASIITDVTSKLTDDNCWKIPVGIGFIFPAFSLFFWVLIPESPRWLLRKGNYAKAVENLDYLYGAMPNYDAEKEAKLLQEALNTSETTGKWKDLVKGTNLVSNLFHGTLHPLMHSLASYRQRPHCCCTGSTFRCIILQFVRHNLLEELEGHRPFHGNHGQARPLACDGNHVHVHHRQGRSPAAFLVHGLHANCSSDGHGWIGHDRTSDSRHQQGHCRIDDDVPHFPLRVFRRPVSSPSLMHTATARNSVDVLYSLQLTKTEIPHITLRDKSVMLFWLTANLCNFISSFTLPYLLQEPANLGSRVGLIYGSISACGLVWGWFCMPEMSKKSLEEIDEMFAAGVPAWKSRRKFITTQFKCHLDRSTDSGADWRGEQTARITELENNGVVPSDSDSERNSIAKSDLQPVVQEKPSKV